MTDATEAVENTDREIWRERDGDAYSPSIFATDGDGIGINVGGMVAVRDVRTLHALAWDGMHWEWAETATIDTSAYYVVQHNGCEWSDFDLAVLSGHMVAHRLKPDYVRGRPVWVAKIRRPQRDFSL